MILFKIIFREAVGFLGSIIGGLFVFVSFYCLFYFDTWRERFFYFFASLVVFWVLVKLLSILHDR